MDDDTNIAGGNEPTMDTGDWRAQLHPDSRQRIVNKMWVSLLTNLLANGCVFELRISWEEKEKRNEKIGFPIWP